RRSRFLVAWLLGMTTLGVSGTQKRTVAFSAAAARTKEKTAPFANDVHFLYQDNPQMQGGVEPPHSKRTARSQKAQQMGAEDAATYWLAVISARMVEYSALVIIRRVTRSRLSL